MVAALFVRPGGCRRDEISSSTRAVWREKVVRYLILKCVIQSPEQNLCIVANGPQIVIPGRGNDYQVILFIKENTLIAVSNRGHYFDGPLL